MALYEQLPGSLSISIVQGDEFATVVDFDINMSGYDTNAEIYSLVDGSVIFTMTTSFVSVGTVNISMTETETGNLSVGTYGWRLQWLAPGSVTRTALTGLLEVKA